MNLTINTGLSGIIKDGVGVAKDVVKGLKKVVDKIKVMPGTGASQKRFIARTLQVDQIFDDAGYPGVGDGFSKYKLRKTQVPNNKPGKTYAPEFQRLMDYAIERANRSNPGLGDYWAVYFPFVMVNEGQIGSESLKRLKEITSRFRPGAYKGEQIWYNLAPSTTDLDDTLEVADPAGALYKKVVDGYTIVADGTGKILEIKNAAGKLLHPDSNEYNDVAGKTDFAETQAGMGGTVGWIVGIGIATALGASLFGGRNAKDKAGK